MKRSVGKKLLRDDCSGGLWLWTLVADLDAKGGLSVELGSFNYILYRRFQSRDSPSITVIVSHLLWFTKLVILPEKLRTC